MTTGAINFPRGATAARPGNSIVYVLETTTGNYAAYGIPWRRELAATGRPQAAALQLLDVGTAQDRGAAGMSPPSANKEMGVEISVNGKPESVTEGLSLLGLLDELKVNRQQVAVEVNAQLVPRERHAACILKAGDRLEIVTLVGGG